MNLSKFLKLVDQESAAKSRKELQDFVCETARKLPVEKREDFLSLLKNAGNSGMPLQGREHQSFQERCDVIAADLAKIENAELLLESEINEKYDDWYNDGEEEFLFSDPDGIGSIVETASQFLYDCIDREEYIMGSEIAEILLELEISASGDYSDCVGEPLSLTEMVQNGLANIDMKKVLLCALHAEYCSSGMKDRSNTLYWIMSDYRSYGITLEKLMQHGEVLPEFDEFLKVWIIYLGNKTGKVSQKLLREAMELSDDENILLENARKYADTHPGLYEEYIKKQMKTAEISEEDSETLYLIGQEALRTINEKYIVRSRIARMMLQIAEKLGRDGDRNDCMLEIFRSDSTPANYMRIRLACSDYQKYESEINRICRNFSMRNERFYPEGDKGELTENVVSKTTAYMLAFLQGDFDFVLSKGMNKKESLGWSGSFMKCGLAAFLLLLLESEKLQIGGKKMCRMVIYEVGSLNIENVKKNEDEEAENETERFWSVFSAWKQTVSITQTQKTSYLSRMEKLVEKRVQGIMEANRRNYYDECAAYVAALGEVKESVGESGGKQHMMEKYRLAYSRRSAFHQALRECGMIKKK